MIDDGVYQGAAGAFSEDAARAMLGTQARLRGCATLEDVFRALDRGLARTGVVPIENSIAGPVPRCAELLSRHHVTIVGELALPVVQALIAPKGSRVAMIRRVLSHPVALAQCARFLQAHPSMVPVPSFDTAGALRDIIGQRSRGAAAIASRRAASIYGGVVLADAIQDRADNVTRFLLVERNPSTRLRSSSFGGQARAPEHLIYRFVRIASIAALL